MVLFLSKVGRHAFQRAVDGLHWPRRRRRVDPYHGVVDSFFLTVARAEKPSVLEIGSRNVTGVTHRQRFAGCGKYVGFDLHPGENVDVAGDAHRLGVYFEPERFDFAIATSVFEHLLFPWKVVLEMNKVLKPGGMMLVTTHPVWPTHELPWDFWRFPMNGFTGLFNKYTGFEIVDCREGLPAQAYSLVNDRPTRGLRHCVLNQGVAVIARKIGPYRADLLKWDIDAADVTADVYPMPVTAE